MQGCARGLGMQGCARGVGMQGYTRGLGMQGCARGVGMQGCARGLGMRGCAHWLLQFEENGKQEDEDEGSRLGHGVPGQQGETTMTVWGGAPSYKQIRKP